jgi:hypothetical protein
VRAAIADGLEDGRMPWAHIRYGDDASPQAAHAIGSVYQALLSGILAQWLIDPERQRQGIGVIFTGMGN